MCFHRGLPQPLCHVGLLQPPHDDNEKPLGTDNGDGDDLPDQIKITILTNTI